MSIKHRLRDWLREREVRRLSSACEEAYQARDKAKFSHFFQQLRVAASARSPEQVARMERAKGLR